MMGKKKQVWKGYLVLRGEFAQGFHSEAIKGKQYPVIALFRWRRIANEMVKAVGDETVRIAPVTITLSPPRKRKAGKR
jgi:hypothetical protein